MDAGWIIKKYSAIITGVLLAFVFMCWPPHTSRAAVLYDFNADTIGQTPANVTATAGTFDVQNDVTLGKALRAETQLGVIAGAIFTSFASTTDQSVVWKQSYSNATARGGFTLRAQSADTSVSVGARQGYLFHVYDSGSVYIWKVGPSSYTALYSGSLAKSQPRWYKAIAQGTALGFYYSDNGSTYTLIASTTDSTYTAGVVQYTAGYGLAVAQDSIDDIVLTDLANPDVTSPSVSLTAPTASSTVQGSSVALSATATDVGGMAGVKFYVDGTLQGSEDTSSPYGISWNSTATTSGAHTAFAVARDTSNNYATSTAVSFTVDNVAPVLSGAAVGTLDTGARFSWLSDKAVSSKVNFGLTSAYGSSSPEIDTSPRLTGHVVDLSGLVSCTLYHYQLQGTDSIGNTGLSAADATFSTSGCGGGAVVSSTTVVTITTTSGGTRSLSQSDIALDVAIPANATATTSSFALQIKSLDGTGTYGVPTPTLSAIPNSSFDVRALINATTTLDSFDVPVTITAHYSANSISGLTESSLRMYHYHAGVWSVLDSCVVDTALKTVTCTTQSFSTFALFGTATPAAVSSRRSSGGSVQNQVQNLISMGNVTAAKALKQQWPTLFQGTPTAPTPSVITVRDLATGAQGEDVRSLQKVLNAHGFLVTKTGAGSLGQETTTFGSLTKAALAAFQKAHAITPAAGYFGPRTRAVLTQTQAAGLWW